MEGKRAVLKRDHETVKLEEYPSERECTRCDGMQHLLGADNGFGKYRCDICQMTIGFDLMSVPAEFVINRGAPGSYTKNIFGTTLSVAEQRLP